MLADITRKMQRKVEKGDHDPLKILVHSTHDTAIAALCSTLDVFDEKCGLQTPNKVDLYSSSPYRWPAFTASITFELFKKTDEQSLPSFPQTVLSSFRPNPTEHCMPPVHPPASLC